MIRLWHRSVGFVGLLVALSFILIGQGIGLAQDATPAGGAPAHPAHIHQGTCDNLDPAPLFPLNDVLAPASAEVSQAAGAGAPVGIEMSTTSVDTRLADIAAGGYAINVHESAANIQTYIACGDIGGAIAAGSGTGEGGQLAIGLRERNGSGYTGVAVLREAGDQTEVTVYLAQGLAGNAGGATEVAHAGHEAAAAAVEVDIKDFAYNPDPLTVAVGQQVTWVNQDPTPHTVTAQDRDLLQSGTLNKGDRYTETFEAAGTYEYVCEFHPNMKGTLIVQ